MVQVGLPTLIGSGAILATVAVIVGFALAVRTDVSAAQLALLVGGFVTSGIAGILLVPQGRTAAIVLAYIIVIGFPLYALFWILHDLVERVVRA